MNRFTAFAAVGILSYVLSLALSACNQDASGPALKQTRDTPEFTVKLNLLEPAALNEKCQSLGLSKSNDYNGCNAFDTVTKVCTIYVAPQRYQQDNERLTPLGHEVWHCRFGAWHE
jgi:hypothetical protein